MWKQILFNLFFNEDSEIGSAIFVPFVSWKLLMKKPEKYNFCEA
jgi:hypothetical protein